MLRVKANIGRGEKIDLSTKHENAVVAFDGAPMSKTKIILRCIDCANMSTEPDDTGTEDPITPYCCEWCTLTDWYGFCHLWTGKQEATHETD